mmetsp:Transcript_12854/g.41986  ORF Transcript_12854/g.41986 Transcript_12854/m.41986 type:complete len:212 (+) Transcript_12854:322-957(+)
MPKKRTVPTAMRTNFCWTSLFCMEAMSPLAAPMVSPVSLTWSWIDAMVSRFRPSSSVMSRATCSVSWATSMAPRRTWFCRLARSLASTVRARPSAAALSASTPPRSFSRSTLPVVSRTFAWSSLTASLTGFTRAVRALRSSDDRASTSICLLKSHACRKSSSTFATLFPSESPFPSLRRSSDVTSSNSSSYCANMAPRCWPPAAGNTSFQV